MLLVVVRHGRRLLVVRGETLTKCFFIVVGALNKRLARDVVLHGLLRRAEDLVVAAAATWVDETSRDAADEELVGDLQFNHMVKLLLPVREHLVKLLSLGRRSRESIENKAFLARTVRLELVLDHADHDFVTDQCALVHDLLGLLSKIRAHGNLLAQEISCSKVAHHVLEALQDLWGLCAFASTWRAHQHHAHALVRWCLALKHGNLFVQLVDERL